MSNYALNNSHRSNPAGPSLKPRLGRWYEHLTPILSQLRLTAPNGRYIPVVAAVGLGTYSLV